MLVGCCLGLDWVVVCVGCGLLCYVYKCFVVCVVDVTFSLGGVVVCLLRMLWM